VRHVNAEELNTSFEATIGRSQKAIHQSKEEIQRSQRQGRTHCDNIANLNQQITKTYDGIFSIVLPTMARSLIVAALKKCFQVLLGSIQSTDEMIGETEKSLKALRVSQGGIETARDDVILEAGRRARLQAELEPQDFAERDCVRSRASDDEIGQNQNTTTDNIPETGREIECQLDQRPGQFRRNGASDDHGNEMELLRHQLTGFQAEIDQLNRSLGQIKGEIREKEKAMEYEKEENRKMQEKYKKLEEEKRGGWCTIL